MFKFTLLVFLFLFISCSSSNVSKGFEKREDGRFYSASAIQKFFLSPLPDWSNFSKTANCKKTFSPRYFNINELMNQLGLSYFDANQFQFLFNIEFEKKSRQLSLSKMTLKEEEDLFYKTYDAILAKNFPFKIPRFKKIHLIWIDPIIKNNEISSYVDSNMFNEGHPVLLSLCYNSHELDDFIEKRKIIEFDLRVLSYEALSIFSSDGSKQNSFIFDLDSFFPSDKEIILFIPKGEKVPDEFKNSFKSIKFY